MGSLTARWCPPHQRVRLLHSPARLEGDDPILLAERHAMSSRPSSSISARRGRTRSDPPSRRDASRALEVDWLARPAASARTAPRRARSAAGRSSCSSCGRCRAKLGASTTGSRSPRAPTAACSREEPQPKLRPAIRIVRPASGRFSSKSGILHPVEEEELAVARALDPLQELLRDDLVGVDVAAGRGRDRAVR